MKSVLLSTTCLIDLCMVNFKNYWGANMLTQQQASKNEGFLSHVRDTVAGRRGWPLCLRHKRRWHKRTRFYFSFCQSCSVIQLIWPKQGSKVCYQVWLYLFFCKVSGRNTGLPHSCCIKFSDIGEANNKVTKSLTMHLPKKKQRGFEEPRTCMAKEEMNFFNL